MEDASRMDTRQEAVAQLRQVIATAQTAINALQSGIIVDRNAHLGDNVGAHFLIMEEIDSIATPVRKAHDAMVKMTPDEFDRLTKGEVKANG